MSIIVTMKTHRHTGTLCVRPRIGPVALTSQTLTVIDRRLITAMNYERTQSLRSRTKHLEQMDAIGIRRIARWWSFGDVHSATITSRRSLGDESHGDAQPERIARSLHKIRTGSGACQVWRSGELHSVHFFFVFRFATHRFLTAIQLV